MVKGIPASAYRYTKQVAEKFRPEASGNADNAGFGTLFFSLEK